MTDTSNYISRLGGETFRSSYHSTSTQPIHVYRLWQCRLFRT